MQELLLFAAVPAARHAQVSAVLAGLTATPTPAGFRELHHVLRPAPRDARAGTDPGGRPPVSVQRGTYSDLVQHFALRGDGDGDNVVDDDDGAHAGDAETRNPGDARWTLHTSETPEGGASARIVISRRRVVTEIDAHGVEEMMTKNSFVPVNRYLLEGHQFVHGNVVLRLQRCLRLLDAPPAPGLDADLSKLSMAPLDRSGAWVLEAAIRLQDAPSMDLLTQGRDELARLKDELDGCVDLAVVNRLALDTAFADTEKSR